MKYRDRVVGLVRLWGDRIIPHPKNWRLHLENQEAAIEGALQEIGIAGNGYAVPADPALLAEVRALKTPEERKKWADKFEKGTGEVLLLDGHLRDKKIRDQPKPIVLLDLNEVEQAEFLATFDPIGALAKTDREKYVDLLQDFNSTVPSIQQMVADLAKVETGDGLSGSDSTGPPENFPSFDENIETEHKCPKCGYAWSGKAS
jgi:hypothetical protein